MILALGEALRIYAIYRKNGLYYFAYFRCILKSSNCMYEVLEVMRNRDYKEKIFPAVIDSRIYKPATRAEYVKYWQNEYEKLNESLKGIFMQNMGNLGNDLKRAQDIAANMAMFLEKISDLNNPNIKNVCMAIETKLREKDLLKIYQMLKILKEHGL